MKRILLALTAALALAGCTTLDTGAGLAAGAADTVGVTPPAAVADKTVLDEQGMLAVELAYKAARIAAETGVDAGVIKGATAQRVAALDNQAFLALAVVRQAYAAGNADSYRAALVAARGAVADLLTLTGKGA